MIDATNDWCRGMTLKIPGGRIGEGAKPYDSLAQVLDRRIGKGLMSKE
jgi:hypothetical protein